MVIPVLSSFFRLSDKIIVAVHGFTEGKSTTVFDSCVGQ